MPQLVTLKAGAAECTLCPDVGGSIISWCIDGQDMLRRAEDAAIASGKSVKVVTLDAGHSLMTEAPDGVLAALKAFLEPLKP